MTYLRPANNTQFELTVKKSRFIAVTGFASDQAQVKNFIKATADKFPDARHTCYGCIVGSPTNGSSSCSDDGEPAGTAGKPILNVLQHSNIGDIVTVVIRYFGGIKLGAGGLVRAYSNAASGSLNELKTTIAENFIALELTADFALESQIRQALIHYNADEINVAYAHQLMLVCKIPEQHCKPAMDQLTNLCRGRITFTEPPTEV